MCGIAGFVGKGTESDLKRMARLLAHRGPDGSGVWLDASGEAGLAHTRLSIIDTSGQGAQPMFNSSGRYGITYNGEIYNYRDLRKQLIDKGYKFRSTTDTEVLLQGYVEWGPEVLNRVEGMFAFAIWDTLTRTLFAARDPAGIKPFFYAETIKGFVFASEVKALIPYMEGTPVMSRRALYSYCLFGFAAPPLSPFEHVYQLQPGHSLLYKNEKCSITCWNSFDIPAGGGPKSDVDCAMMLRAELKRAVDDHMIADVDVGVTLSGGLDSSSVLASLAQSRSSEEMRGVHCFTVGYGLPDDELEYARAMIMRYPAEYHERVLEFDKCTSLLPQIMWHLEEPLPHIGMATTWQLAEFVKEKVKAVLIGEGSDEVFGGYPYYTLFQGPWKWLVPDVLKTKLLFARPYKMLYRSEWDALLTGDYRPDSADVEWVRVKYGRYFGGSGKPVMDRMLLYEMENLLVASQLSRIDRMTMAHGVEARVPFLDKRLIRLGLSVPWRFKRTGGTDKTVLRNAMTDLLPEKVVHRPKTGRHGTQSITESWFRGSLGEWCASYLTKEKIDKVGIFNPHAVAQLTGRSTGVQKMRIVSQKKVMFFIALVHLWHEVFVENGSRPNDL